MNQAIDNLIEQIENLPVGTPPKSATKAELNQFIDAYAKWVIRLYELAEIAKAANKRYSELTGEEAEERVREAEAVLRAEYWSDIRGLADEIIAELKDKLTEDEPGEPLCEWLIERIQESVDSHHNVINTAAAQKALLYTDNSCAYVEDFGDEGLSEDGNINWTGMAWAAMRRDVREQLDAYGINLNNPCDESTREFLDLEIE